MLCRGDRFLIQVGPLQPAPHQNIVPVALASAYFKDDKRVRVLYAGLPRDQLFASLLILLPCASSDRLLLGNHQRPRLRLRLLRRCDERRGKAANQETGSNR